MTDSSTAAPADTPSISAPLETIIPSPEALAWAREVTQPGGRLPTGAEGILARLHAPGLPDLVEELAGIINTYATSDRPYDAYPSKLSNSPVRHLLDQQTQALRLRVFLCSLMISKQAHSGIDQGDGSIVWIYYLHSDTADFLLRKPLPWDAATLSLVLHAAELDLIPYEYALTACEKAGTDTLTPCLEQLRTAHRHHHAALVEYRYGRILGLPEEYVRTVQLLLRLGDPLAVDHLLIRGDVFTGFLRERAPDLFSHPGLAELFAHCLTRPGARPKNTWWNGLRERLAAVPDAAETIRRVLELAVAAPESEQASHDELPYHYRPHVADVLNGLVWVIAALPEEKTDPWAFPLLERIILFTGTGPGGSKVLRSERMATAAIRTLAGRGEEDEVVASLGKVRARIKKKTVLRTIDEALGGIAAQSGITNEELLERTVPSYGLDRDGTRTDRLGEHGVTLSVSADGTASLGFLSAKGRPVASPPKVLREAHPEEVKALRAELKELRQTLAAERVRLEGFLSEGRVWDAGPWVRHYLEHPVTGVLARRLLWEMSTDGGATWAAGLPEPDGDHWRLADADGFTVARVGPADARVRLWHPVRHAPETVRRWREHLTDRETAQPVKQAYREIYLITPAEETTRTYSNRFAAHILKYGQAKALLGTRGWYVPQLGGWDDGHYGSADRVYTDRVTGTAWRAELDLAMPGVNDLDDSGRAANCATDQVRLYQEEEGEEGNQRRPAPLADVPTLALSEALRDVDLAVGVTSIAADPQWIDGGERPHLGYWRDTAFGELTESAAVRREALERLVPRLRIADRLEITNRYLRVRGDLRTYRIHLGSANMLMEPDDSYLCVVVSGKRGPGVFLPFEEGGGRLSVILSKAFMFTKDTAITDPGISSQIRRGLE